MTKYGIGARVRNSDGYPCEVIGKPKKGVREIRLMGGNWDGAVYWADKSSLELANDNITATAAWVPAVGDFVRRKNDNHGNFREGAVGRVESVVGTAVTLGGDVADYSHQIDNLEPWVPKVGDRVRVVKHCNWQGESLPLCAAIGSEHDVTEMRDYFDDKGVATFVLSGGGHNFYTPVNIEPVTAPATAAVADKPFTITAGKFCRTGGGRKVGPMVYEGHWADGFPWTAAGWDEYAADNGKAQWHGDDIVAEWVEPKPEVTVDPVALNREPSLGDMLRSALVGHTFRMRVSPPVERYIICLVENGQPLPSAKPHVHRNRDAADQEQNRLARKHPGKEFAVYRRVSTIKADVNIRQVA